MGMRIPRFHFENEMFSSSVIATRQILKRYLKADCRAPAYSWTQGTSLFIKARHQLSHERKAEAYSRTQGTSLVMNAGQHCSLFVIAGHQLMHAFSSGTTRKRSQRGRVMLFYIAEGISGRVFPEGSGRILTNIQLILTIFRGPSKGLNILYLVVVTCKIS